MEQSFASHHLPLLSGSSQTPLILTSGNENGSSERSTPLSAHSLHFSSPLNGNKQTPTLFQQHHRNQQNHQHHQRPHPSTPLILNSVTSAHNNPRASIFFPPVPLRSNHHHHHQQQQQQQLQHQQSSSRTQFSLESAALNNNKSPGSADLNMNAESERNREVSRVTTSTNISPNQNIRLSSKQLSSNATPFPGFFQEHLLQFSPKQPSRKSVNLTNNVNNSEDTSSTGAFNDNNPWPQQKQDDENYHLYHEPIDPDEQETPPQTSRSQNLSNERSAELKFTSTDSIAQIKKCPPPRQPKMNQKTSINSNNTNGKEWPFVVPKIPKNDDSLTAVACDGHSNNSSSSVAPTTSNTAENTVPNRRDDVSADIYRRYVTLRSPERTDHRSRSYHGPKNTNLHSQPNQSLYNRDGSKNLSSTSIADLPTSPSAMVSTSIPIPFRDHCVRELIETESNYVHALDMIITCFARPMDPLLKKEENQLIFGHIKYFHHIHSSFQSDLVKAAFMSYNRDISILASPNRNSLSVRAGQNSNQTNSNPSTPTSVNNIPQQFLEASPLQSPVVPISPPLSTSNKGSNGSCPKISSCFLNIKDKFLKYGEYCSSLSKAQALLDDLANRNEAIASQLDRCQQDANEGKFKLRDLLSLPMQRILKYHLLLAQLIKNDTSSTNEDYHGLQRAHEAMLDLGQYINEVKRDTEALQIINDIEKTITGLNMPPNTQLSDYGRLVTDGFIRIKVPHDSRTKLPHDSKIKLPHDLKIKQKRYVFVFDKVMLICKVSGVRGYQYKEALVLSEYEFDINPATNQTDTLSKHTAKEKWSFNFNLIRSSDRTIYSFYAKTLELKNKWVDAIQKAMDNIRPAACRNNKTNHEFLMHTFDKASSCDHCGKLLLGLYYQGYRCRSCFTSAHKGCLAQTRPCGPKLPPRLNNTLNHPRLRCDEPPSPSVRSNCSDDSHHFMHFPPSNSSSTLCVNSIPKNEYSNIDGRTELIANPSSSFRENSSRPNFTSHRPVSSMINVSLQNSTNHLLVQRRMLKGNSSPSIGSGTTLKAKALSDYEGSESNGHLKINSGDMLLICTNFLKQKQSSTDGIDNSLAQLRMSEQNNDQDDDCTELWFGKNLQTGKEGLFPSKIVELLNEQCRIQSQGDNPVMEGCANDSHENDIGWDNFLLRGYPWYHGRMERDKAQSALENMPHGTFLVRVSAKHNGNFVISLNYSSQVKHMRIHVKDNQHFLSQNRYFKSIPELVSWYERNSLSESFNMLDAKLAIPYKSR